MTELRGALIGCGFFAVNQMHAWQDVAGAAIVAICDRDPERLTQCFKNMPRKLWKFIEKQYAAVRK